MTVKIRNVKSVFGPVKMLEGMFCRLYVKTCHTVGHGKSYALSSAEHMTLATMVDINGQYHWDTLKGLLESARQATNS